MIKLNVKHSRNCGPVEETRLYPTSAPYSLTFHIFISQPPTLSVSHLIETKRQQHAVPSRVKTGNRDHCFQTCCMSPLSPAEAQRFDPLSNVCTGTELQATAESAGASARYHTQDGRHPGETIFSELLSGVTCVPCVTVKMEGKILKFSDV